MLSPPPTTSTQSDVSTLLSSVRVYSCSKKEQTEGRQRKWGEGARGQEGVGRVDSLMVDLGGEEIVKLADRLIAEFR